jgi:hypothetical protein
MTLTAALLAFDQRQNVPARVFEVCDDPAPPLSFGRTVWRMAPRGHQRSRWPATPPAAAISALSDIQRAFANQLACSGNQKSRDSLVG